MMRASTRSTRGRSNETYSVSGSDSGRRFTTTWSPRSRRSSHARHCRSASSSSARARRRWSPSLGDRHHLVRCPPNWTAYGRFLVRCSSRPFSRGENPGASGEGQMTGDPPDSRRPQIHPSRLVPGPRPRIDLRNRFLRRPEFRNSRELFSRSNDNIRGRERNPLKKMLRNEESSSEGQVCGELTKGNDRTRILRDSHWEPTTRTWELTTGTARVRQLRTQLF
jgi:hypothetical protein